VNSNEHRWIEERLQAGPAPEPPEGLLESIQEEIPRHLEIVPEPAAKTREPWKLRLLAASVLIVVLSGTVVYRLGREIPDALEQQVTDSIESVDRSESELPGIGALAPAAQENVPSPVIVGDVGEIEVMKDDVAAEPRPEVAEQAMARRSAAMELEKRVKVPETRPDRDEGLDRRALEQQVLSESPPLDVAGKREAARPSSAQAPIPDPRPQDPRLGRESMGPAYVRPERAMRTDELRLQAAPSTGGTAEPNEAPYGDMFFRSYGTNPFIDTEDDSQSTFGLDVDTGSFTLARGYLDRGHLPPPEAIRVEEFVNYFDYRDPAPRRGEFTLVAEGAPSLFASGPRYQVVRFGIKAREIRPERRQPATLIFVVDTSGSMGREGRLELVKRSLRLLLDELNHEDRIGLVVYGSRGEVILEPTGNREGVRRAIDRLYPHGSTNAEEGLDLAYEMARRFYREGDIHRLILCSDGVANVGRTGPESILERVRREADEGIELTTVGFGMGNYNDVLMEQLADQGDGSYAYVDSLDESRRIFVENLTGTLQTIGAEARVQVEFDPDTVSRYRLIGYENRDIPDDRFRDDTVDAGEIGAGHAVTALYEIKLHEGVGRRQRLATMHLRYRSQATGKMVETSVDFSRSDLTGSWEDSSAALRLSSLAAEFAEILKGSYWARESDLDELYRRLRRVADELEADAEVEDLLYLVDRARRLSSDLPRYIEE
jgi:Ca-activated chloride channel family protein